MEKNYVDKNNVAGIVVLYNPSNLVIKNIYSYLSQVDHLFIIDNSEEESFFVKDKISLSEKVTYIFNNANIGIAAALNLGAKIAIEKDFSFLLTMDQDSKAPSNMVTSLLKIFQNNKNTGLASPLHSNRYNTHLRFEKEIEEVKTIMTSGNLLSLEVYKKLGEFKNDFFIDYVDIEYCFRMSINNYNIYRLNTMILEHNEADLSSKSILNRTFYPHNHQPFRFYYKTRNLLYLRKMYKSSLSNLLRIEYDSYLRTVVKAILFENQKFLKIKMIFLGIWDYFMRKKGHKF